MSIRKHIIKWMAMTALPFYFFIFLLLSCTTDSYDKGQGKYSLMQAELVDLSINSEKEATAFTLDDGNRFTLTPYATAKWIETADTTYRAVLYYNQVSETTAEPVSLGAVPTLRAVKHWQLRQQPEDPIGIESAWLSKNRKYLNLGLLLKTGQADDNDGTQKVALAQDTIRHNDDQTCTAVFRLLHDQCGVPQYYTSRRFISILLPDTVKLDTIRLTIPTYDGQLERIFLP
ncbi:MAG: NigD-like N-terminal domain-containing protein [Prevotella sp.]|nr:NigD-like N-terminal domain-containing protein [Prevotella sp.]